MARSEGSMSDNENGYAERFKGRAEDCSKNRPRYPQELLHTLENELGFSRRDVAADIGSGTGILSELFVENGNLVYCVEPNKDMRRVAEGRLKRHAPLFVSVDGRAESTRLKGGSVDLIAVGGPNLIGSESSAKAKVPGRDRS